jgi:hypothetical protein
VKFDCSWEWALQDNVNYLNQFCMKKLHGSSDLRGGFLMRACVLMAGYSMTAPIYQCLIVE